MKINIRHSSTVTMSPPPFSSDETRLRILTEAERLFRHYGYAKTTVADIADACTMSSANVYRFFPSKSAITEAICARVIADLESQLWQIVRRDASAADRLVTFIETISRHTVETLVDQKKVHDMVVVAMEENWGAIESHLVTTVTMIAGIIESGMDRGEFRRQDAASAARCVHASIAALKHPVLVAQCRDDPYHASPQDMAAFILSALKA